MCLPTVCVHSSGNSVKVARYFHFTIFLTPPSATVQLYMISITWYVTWHRLMKGRGPSWGNLTLHLTVSLVNSLAGLALKKTSKIRNVAHVPLAANTTVVWHHSRVYGDNTVTRCEPSLVESTFLQVDNQATCAISILIITRQHG